VSEQGPELTLRELLIRNAIDPEHPLVFRHRPTEPELNRNFDFIVGQRPDLFDCYQNTHNERTESALKRATHLVSFIRRHAGQALFVGLYEVAGWTELSSSEWETRPAQLELVGLGMAGASGSVWRESILEFNLKPSDILASWRRRLIVGWPPPERSWYRWADRNTFPVLAVCEDDALRPPMPDWHEISLSRAQLAMLPPNWQSALRQWRGVYLITDQSDRRAYVGSAGGAENILQRWQDYGRTGHGGNKHLRSRDAVNFVFSILQRTSPDLPQDELVKLEVSWKMRLGTRWPNGLNEN
jgi:hypothetical protein